jgi:putative flavoprotein involved in K+ transport
MEVCMKSTSESFDTVVVGGGQAGLAAGYYLAKRGLSFVILDASRRIGDSWRNRWDSLLLFTPARFCGLPGWPFQGRRGWEFPSKDDAADYLEAYAKQFKLPIQSGVTVHRVTKQGSRYVVSARDRRLLADNLVVATGAFQKPKLPAFATELDPRITQLHSSAYRNPAQLRSGEVLVVGAGNSGAELALELSRDGRKTWLSGRITGEESPLSIDSLPDRLLMPLFWFVGSRLLTTKSSAGRKLRARSFAMGWPLVRVKNKAITAAGIERLPRTVGVKNGAPLLEDGRALEVPNIIWATGYEEDLGWIDLPLLGPDGRLAHERGVVASQPGLYFIGNLYLYSATSALLGGVGRDAEYTVSHLASRPKSACRAQPGPGRATTLRAKLG